MSILKIDDKWSVVYDPKSNDRLMEWLRNGNTQCEFDENNAVVAMFYALKEANAALTQSRAETAAVIERAAVALDAVAGQWSCGHPAMHCDCARDIEQWGFAADEVRALATPEQSSALAAIEAAAEARGMRRAAEIATNIGRRRFTKDMRELCSVIARRILAAIPAIDPAAIREAALKEAYDRIGAIVAGYELREDFRAEEIAGRCHDAILALIGEKK